MENLYCLREEGMPLVIAHKGLSSILPENTTEAVILSLDYAELTEFDVMLTYDN
jgi:glycerophosphoryl diester phosphodiesterase